MAVGVFILNKQTATVPKDCDHEQINFQWQPARRHTLPPPGLVTAQTQADGISAAWLSRIPLQTIERRWCWRAGVGELEHTGGRRVGRPDYVPVAQVRRAVHAVTV